MTYRMTMSTTLDERGDTLTVYGIEGAGLRYDDLSHSRERVEALVRDCNDLELEPCHLRDVVYDFIASGTG